MIRFLSVFCNLLPDSRVDCGVFFGHGQRYVEVRAFVYKRIAVTGIDVFLKSVSAVLAKHRIETGKTDGVFSHAQTVIDLGKYDPIDNFDLHAFVRIDFGRKRYRKDIFILAADRITFRALD